MSQDQTGHSSNTTTVITKNVTHDSRLTTHVSLEEVLHEVHATVTALLAAAEDQYQAMVAHDRQWMERVTQRQERLAARLARAERKRLEIVGNATLAEAIAALPPAESARANDLKSSIAEVVGELKSRQSATSSLLARSIDLSRQTLEFLQRVVTKPSAVYGARGMIRAQRSMLMDSRA